MAFEKIGLGGVLKFNETQALAGMKRAGRGFARLRSGARSVGSGLASIGSGARSAALALTPVAIGLALGVKKAAEFEKQMSAVGAITRASEEDFGRLTAEAKRLGVVSVFSASESAQAMEFLGRAGFNTSQIITGLGGVMNAAAAEGVDLATSADIIARVVKSMGEEIDSASHIADILVLTSAKTNTNLTALGESFKFGAAQAKVMGISTEETAAIFGKLADAGLRGSIGGTALTNMLIKLAKPTSKGSDLMKKWGVSLTDSTGALRPMPQIIEQFKKKIDKIPSATEKARVMTELFGIRGSKAYSALALAGGKALGDLTADLKASSFGVGAAAEAAERRLDNFLGAMKLFGSSLEALSIEFFGPLLTVFKDTTQDMTRGLNSVLFSIQGLSEANQAFTMAAGRQAKERAKNIATELGLVKRLGDRQAANAQAGLAAVTRAFIGEEKLTRAQRAARAQGFATFIEQGLMREKISKKGREAQRKHLKEIVATAKAQGLSGKQEAALRKRFLESLVAQRSGVKQLGNVEKARASNKLEAMLREQAEQAAIDAKARGLLEREKKLAEVEEKHGRTARLIAEGVLEAIDSIKTGFKTVVQQVKDFGERMREAIGEDNLKRFTKIATISVVVAGALAPVLLGLMGIAFVLKSVIIPQIVGVGKVLFGLTKIAIGLTSGALLPIVAVVGVIALAFLAFRKEGESVGDTLTRAWGMIKAAVVSVWETGIKPFIKGFKTAFLPIIDQLRTQFVEAWERIKAQFAGVINTIMPLWDAFADFFGLSALGMSSTWESFGATVATVIGTAVSIALDVVTTLVSAFLAAQQAIASAVTFVWQNVIKPFWEGFVEMFVPILDQLQTKFTAVWDSIVVVFNEVVTTFTDLWNQLAGDFGVANDTMSVNWVAFGETIANVVGFILESVLDFIQLAVNGFRFLSKVLLPVLILPFTTFWNASQRVLSGILTIFRGDFAGGITKIMTGLANVLLLPLRMMTQGILQVVKLLPPGLVDRVVSKDTLAKLQKFADVGIGPAAGKRRPASRAAVAAELATPEGAKVIDLASRRKRRRRDLGSLGDQRTVAGVLAQRGLKRTPENVKLAQAVLRQSAQMRREDAQSKRKAAKAADRKLEAQVSLKDERKTTIKNSMCVEGREVAQATATHKQTVFERSGGVTEPFLRRQRAEQGVAVAGNSREVA